VEDGNRFQDVKKMDDSAQSEITSLAREALFRLIRNRDIEFRGVIFDNWLPGQQTSNMRVQWVNLRARDKVVREATLSIPPEES
jgi:hypothetical protein